MGRERLTAMQVARLRKPGLYADGGGLYLQIRGGEARSWIFRYRVPGGARERYMGLGAVADVPLAAARRKAAEARALLREGQDPLAVRAHEQAARRLAEASAITFREAAERYLAAHEASWRNAKHRAQWRATLETYAYSALGALPVAAIETAHVLKALEPIWTAKPETASRLQQRIARVLDWAAARGYRAGENPARWRGHLDHLLPRPEKLKRVRNHPALPYHEIPAFMAALRRRDSISARALEFTILTAARTGETIGATWDEIDLAETVWTIPAERMKARKEHRVPLCARALEILSALPRGGEYVFPGARKGAPLSNMAMLETLREMRPGLTVHGFRSTFRTWAAEQTNYRRDVCEAALAHTVKGVEGTYQRGDLFLHRRRLMAAWESYCASSPRAATESVVALWR